MTGHLDVMSPLRPRIIYFVLKHAKQVLSVTIRAIAASHINGLSSVQNCPSDFDAARSSRRQKTAVCLMPPIFVVHLIQLEMEGLFFMFLIVAQKAMKLLQAFEQ